MGGEPITSFGVFMLLSFLTGGMLLRSEMERTGHDPDRAWDLVFMAVLGGVIGAKAYYVLLNHEGASGQSVIGHFFTRRNGVVRWIRRGASSHRCRDQTEVPATRTDRGPLFPNTRHWVCRWPDGMFPWVGDDYGRPTGSWVGIKFPNGTPATSVESLERNFGIQVDPALVERFGQVVPVHPTQLYEVTMASLIFLVLWKLRVHEHGAGWLFWICLTLLSVERFLVEFVRVKDDRFFGPLTLAQGIAITLVLVGLWGARRAWSLGGEPEGEKA